MRKSTIAALLCTVAISLAISGCLIGSSENTTGDGTVTADFQWNNYPSTLSVYFEWDTDLLSIPDGMEFDWDFGDGQTGTGSGTTHEYEAPGVYTVALTATYDGGSPATSSQEVTITGYGEI